ncbi:hypothetical protein [Microbacterium sp. SSM24]|uniref:hypothetical protein n=1 Tax=Microbacterium sp. SSM24 TaxID=2991714 RepID=UPI0022261A94|nr:hypothetical protein [Microbacterium sp. SSM24]MCW3494788.1 hypothetical protein [Microbacterium sp. SSM24]
MTFSKQLINLLGLVVVLAIVVAGVAMLALPLYSQSQSTDLAVNEVTQTNDMYALQVEQLRADEARIDEITASVALLRGEITALPQLDDVHELVEAAAGEAKATVVSVIAESPVTWIPRTVVTVAEDGETAAAEEAAPAEGAPADGAATEAESTEASGDTTEESAAGGEAPTEVVSPQQQVPVVITVEVPDASTAAAFIDALDAGPRLIGIESAVLSDQDGVLQLIVNALAFIRIED